MRTYPHQFDHRKYSDYYLLSCISEADVQSAITDYLAAEGIPYAVVDAGAKRLRGRCGSGGGGAAPSGFPDITGVLPGGRALYIEVKAPQWRRLNNANRAVVERSAGEPSRDQLHFLDAMHEAGALVMVAWSVEEVIEEVQAAMIRWVQRG